MDVGEIIREYLPNVLHMSLATCVDNRPWVCELHFVYDDDLHIYWRSKTTRRHSQEIARNPRVAGNIVEQHALSSKPRGLYFEGTAELVEDLDENGTVYKGFIARLGANKDFVAESKTADGHKIYKVTVSDWYLFDARDANPARKYRMGNEPVTP